MLRAVRKLRGRSRAEIGTRATQALAALLERLAGPIALGDGARGYLRRVLRPGPGVSSGDLAALLDDFRDGAPRDFFPAFDDLEATLAVVRSRWPASIAATIDRADRAAAGRFDLLGRRDLSYGSPIDWHVDPVADKRAPLVHWSRVPYLDPAVVGDHKVVWELNRHQHFVTFGQAYRLTRDSRYAAAFTSQLGAWMDANPLKLGMNWASSLEVSFRAISWIWALHLMRPAPELTPALYGRALAYLHASARHLEQYLSTYFSPNTHLTGEALGLLYIGVCFPEFRDAARWRRTGWRVLVEQLDKQVRADGVYFEQASYYHRYTTDFYLHAAVLRGLTGDEVPRELDDRLAGLLDHLAALVRPDGRLALVGDDDGGRLLMLTTCDPADARATLALGGARYGRADWAAAGAGASEEIAWIMGAPGVRQFDALRDPAYRPGSRAFPDGGYFVMREGGARAGNFVLIDCGPHGTMNCGHAHADALAIEVTVAGRPMLVDSGTYTYPGAERNDFRGTAAHNTVTLDDQGSSLPGSPFAWLTVARASPHSWAAHERFAYFVGAHDGYRRLAAPADVARTVIQLPGVGWVIADRVTSTRAHTMRMHYHAAPGVAVTPAANGVTLRAEPAAANGAPIALRVATFGPRDATGARGGVDVGEGWVSPLYGVREPAATVTVVAETVPGDHESVTFLLAESPGEGVWEVVELRAERGRIFAFSAGGRGRGVLVRGGAGRGALGDGVETDAEWLWLSPSPAAADEFVLIDGTSLVIAGHAVAGIPRTPGWVVGHRVHSEWGLEHGPLDRFSGE